MKKILILVTFCVYFKCKSQSTEDIITYSPTFTNTISDKKTTNIGVSEMVAGGSTTGLALPAYNNSLRVNSLLDSIYSVNKNIKFMEGFRIQVFNGDSKEQANEAKEYLYKIFPNADIYTVYKQPTYRIKLGDFTSRHDAKRVLEKKILKAFPRAILIPDNIFLKQKVYYE